MGGNPVQSDGPSPAELEMARRAQAEADGAAGRAGGGGIASPTSKLVPPLPIREYKYEIGGQKFILGEPVLGQQEQLAALLKDVKLDLGEVVIDFEDPEATINRILAKVSPGKLLATMAEKATGFFAIILTPEGASLENKKLDEVTRHLYSRMGVTRQPEVLRDFFVLSKSLLAEMVRGLQNR